MRSGQLAHVVLLLAFTLNSSPLFAEDPGGKVLQADKDMPSDVTVTGQLCPTEDDDARAAYDEGYRAADEGRMADAKRSYHEAIEHDPEFCDAFDNLGRLYRLEGDVETAIGLYRSSLTIKEDNPVALQNLGLALLLDNQIDEAVATYERLIALDVDNPEGSYGLGMLLIQLDRADEAIPHLERAEALYQEQGSSLVSDARVLLALAHALNDDCAEARDYLKQVSPELVPPDVSAGVEKRCGQ